MHLFLCYDLSKRYCENFFVTLFYNLQSKLFIRFVSKKNLKKFSIRCVVQALMFLTLDFIKITLFLNESIARFFPEQVNIGIEPTAHRKATKRNFIFYFHVIHHFLGNSMLNSNLNLAITSLDFNIFKNGFRI